MHAAMTADIQSAAGFTWARLVPELLVTDIAASLAFWRDLCGFRVAFDRPEEGFAYLDRDGAQVMLDQAGRGRDWITAPLAPPLGRGINLQIGVTSIRPILEALARGPWPLFMAPEEKWYRTGASETGVRQFLVQDPDGYLVRFAEDLGERPLGAADPEEPAG